MSLIFKMFTLFIILIVSSHKSQKKSFFLHKITTRKVFTLRTDRKQCFPLIQEPFC